MEHDLLEATPHFDRINPSACVNAKLRRLHRLINSAYQAHINPFGLRGSMLSILFIIGKRPGVNQKYLAEALVLDASTMSRDLKRLMEKGWIRHTSAGADARVRALYLSRAGQELLEEVSPVWEALHQKVSSLLGAFQIQQIDAVTRAITEHLDTLRAPS